MKILRSILHSLFMVIWTVAWAIRHPHYAWSWYRHGKTYSTRFPKGCLMVATLLLVLALPRTARAQTLSGAATNVDIPTEVNALMGTMPESDSWSNTSIKIDVAYSALGIGQTGTAEAVLRGTYNLGGTNSIFGLGLESDFGAGNAVDALYAVGELHKELSPWAEVFAAGGGGYSWAQNGAQGFIGVGTRVIPFGSIPQAALFDELDFILNTSPNQNSAPHTRILAGLTYHF